MDKSDYKKIIKGLVEEEKKRTWGYHERYIINQQDRFNYILKLCKSLNPDPEAQLLDIGRSDLTLLLYSFYNNVTSLGFPLEMDHGAHRETSESPEEIQHIVYDLTHSKNTKTWPEYPGVFDLIVYSETIEHIHIAPEFTLLMLHYLLKKDGKIVVTTPNALSIYKRMRMLIGMHPFQKIRYFEKNPGHFREYTLQELIEMGKICRLKTYFSKLINFTPFNPLKSFKALKYLPLKPLELIPSFRDNIVIVYEKI